MSFHKLKKTTTKTRRHKVLENHQARSNVSMNGKSAGTVTFGFGDEPDTSRTL
jgi:hypothetical protein